MAPNSSAVDDLRAKLANDASVAITDKMPRYILHLHKILNELEKAEESGLQPGTSEFSMLPSSKELKNIYKETKVFLEANKDGTASVPPNKKRKVVDAEATSATPSSADLDIVPSNDHLIKLMATLKPELMEGLNMLGQVKTWISLNIPRIEDGNNFGVGVQEECVAEVGRVEDSGFEVLEMMTKYFQTRARIVHKMTKHSELEDYRRAVIECDYMQNANMRICLEDVRNNFMVLHDLLVKNLEKLKRPRGSGEVNMMY